MLKGLVPYDQALLLSTRGQSVNLRKEELTENIPFRTGLVSQQVNMQLVECVTVTDTSILDI